MTEERHPLPSFTSIKVDGRLLKGGWTKKRLQDLLQEQIQYVKFQIEKRSAAIDFLIQSYKARSALIARLPPSYDKISFVDYMNGVQSPVDDANEAKLRALMEWEDDVRTLTGKRLRTGQPSGSANRSASRPAVKRGHFSEDIRTNLQTVTEETTKNVLQTKDSKIERSTGKRTNRSVTTVVSSTPANSKVETFAVPTLTRATATRRAARGRLKRRMPKPEDTLLSARGSAIINPFELGAEKSRLTAADMKLAKYLYSVLKKQFD